MVNNDCSQLVGDNISFESAQSHKRRHYSQCCLQCKRKPEGVRDRLIEVAEGMALIN